MANVDVEKLSKDDKDELVCTYAALLLHDSKLEITVSTPTFRLCLIDTICLGRKIEQGN